MTERYPNKKRKTTALKWWGLPLCCVMSVLFAGCFTMPPLEETESTLVQPTVETTSMETVVNENRVEINLLGDAQITLEYGEAFEDPGVQAMGYGTLINIDGCSLDVEVKGTVNDRELGVYTITYSATYEGEYGEVTRTVTVVDTQAPKIELVSDPDGYIIPGEVYIEEGFRAIDNYDGDISDRVERRQEKNKVTYCITDSSGNSTQVVRKIRYYDPVGPKLTLLGEKTTCIQAGGKWVEPGYQASDNLDGDLTSMVQVEGTVNGYSAGTYVVTYEVTDSYGNKARDQRVVIVEAVARPETVIPEGKVVYLTFDDGPSDYTQKLLEVLKKYEVQATFFVVKTARVDLLDDIAAGGHALGVHSKNHRYDKIYANEDAFFNDLYAMQDLIFQHTGIKTMLMRFPGGSSNHVSVQYNEGIMTRLTKAVQDQGFQYFDWNVSAKDAESVLTKEEVVKNVIDGIQANRNSYSVVLQHDIRDFSVEAVEEIIVWCLDNGYSFHPLEMTSPTCHHFVKN